MNQPTCRRHCADAAPARWITASSACLFGSWLSASAWSSKPIAATSSTAAAQLTTLLLEVLIASRLLLVRQCCSSLCCSAPLHQQVAGTSTNRLSKRPPANFACREVMRAQNSGARRSKDNSSRCQRCAAFDSRVRFECKAGPIESGQDRQASLLARALLTSRGTLTYDSRHELLRGDPDRPTALEGSSCSCPCGHCHAPSNVHITDGVE